jgi:hypothetical protein
MPFNNHKIQHICSAIVLIMICIFVKNTLLHWDCICSVHREKVSLAQPQAQAVLKDPRLSPLVPAARRQRRQRRRCSPRATAAALADSGQL